jgi:RimJ/RimL family protein N-acetyltransferase
MKNRDIVLTGEKVALATMTEEDQPQFQRWLASNAELRELIDDQRTPTMEDQILWFRRIQQPDRKFFSLVTVPDETLVGNAGFVDIDAKEHSAVLRITIGNPDYLGKGLGSEAIALLIRYAFQTAGFELLSLKVLRGNLRAIRTYEKNGFKVTREDLHEGKSILTMALSRSDYLSHVS